MTTRANHPRRTRPVALILIALATVIGSAVAAPAAYAASSTTCTGSSDITYSPGLTNTARTVQYTETDTLASCLSSDPAVTSGSSEVSISLPGASCLATPAIVTNTPYTITWNDSESSDINLSFTDAIVEGIEQVTGVGTVTSGLFQGANVTLVWLYTVPNPLLCLTSQGVTNQTGILTAQVTGL